MIDAFLRKDANTVAGRLSWCASMITYRKNIGRTNTVLFVMAMAGSVPKKAGTDGELRREAKIDFAPKLAASFTVSRAMRGLSRMLV